VRTDDIASLIHSGAGFANVSVESILRPVVAVPATKTIHGMLEFFRRRNTTTALVFNEWGSVDGFVTLRQVLRFFIGVLNDSSGDDHSFEVLENGRFVVSGQMHIEHINDLLNSDLDHLQMKTIGGLVFQALDRLPVVGDEVDLPGVRTRVRKMNRHRIDRLEVSAGADLTDRDAAPPLSDASAGIVQSVDRTPGNRP